MIQTNLKWWLNTVGADLGTEEFTKAKRFLVEGSYKEFGNSKFGEIILHELFDFCGFDKVNYSNDFKPETLAFLEGQRSVLLHILQMCEMSQLVLMKKGAKNG